MHAFRSFINPCVLIQEINTNLCGFFAACGRSEFIRSIITQTGWTLVYVYPIIVHLHNNSCRVPDGQTNKPTLIITYIFEPTSK